MRRARTLILLVNSAQSGSSCFGAPVREKVIAAFAHASVRSQVWVRLTPGVSGAAMTPTNRVIEEALKLRSRSYAAHAQHRTDLPRAEIKKQVDQRLAAYKKAKESPPVLRQNFILFQIISGSATNVRLAQQTQ